MKKIPLFPLLSLFALLSGCTTLWTYEPKISSLPNDNVKYQIDLKNCRDYVWKVNQPNTGEVMSGAGGLVGGLIYSSVSDEKKPTGNSFSQVDRCMAAKGYKIIN